MNREGISDEDYQHAQNVWKKFNMTNMGEYHDLYLKTDVLLLADVFEGFRKLCELHYKLDPAHYHTTPGLAWDAMLKMTGVQLELLTDSDMLIYLRGILFVAYTRDKLLAHSMLPVCLLKKKQIDKNILILYPCIFS